jgi:O-antigen/teichoic acid export membrane protein
LGFLLQRLDLILVLNFGGLAVLGKFVAIMSLARLIWTVNGFFFETLLPSLTNTLATRNYAAASQVFSMNLRTLFVVTLIGTSGLIAMINPLAMLLGSKYASLSSVFVLGVLLCGLAAPGAIAGTLLTSVGKQHRLAFVSLVQLGLFLALFYELWPRYQLVGGVLATGVSMIIAAVLVILAARYGSEVKFSIFKDYMFFALVLVAGTILDLRLMKLGVTYPLLALPAVVLLFCGLAGYRMAECKAIVRCFLPSFPTDAPRLP